MKRQRLLSLLLIAAAALVTSAHAQNSCIDCHQKSEFFAEYPKLHSYYQQWLDSPHEQAGLGCDDCHGGNAAADSMRRAHRGMLPMSSRNSSLHAMRQPDTCGSCHRENASEFTASAHYAALMGARAAPTCTTCHPAMSQRPELRAIVLNACRNCHGPDNKEGLPLIADEAERVFNHLNIASGLIGWTRIHFQSHDWPADSRERVGGLEKRYAAIVSQVHRFDLARTEAQTVELLAELRALFNEARREHEEHDGSS